MNEAMLAAAADEAFDSEDYAAALVLCDQLVATCADAAKYRAYRGLAKYHLGDLAGAIDDFSAALASNPGAASTYYMRAQAHRQRGDPALAVEDYSACLKIEHGRRADAYLARAKAYRDLMDLDAAWRDVESGLEVNPGSSDLYELRALLAIERHYYDKALVDLAKAEELGAPPESTAYNKAIALEETGATDEALEHYAVAVSASAPSFSTRCTTGADYSPVYIELPRRCVILKQSLQPAAIPRSSSSRANGFAI
jgi:tetratricopeptide (TPR) repeat protein